MLNGQLVSIMTTDEKPTKSQRKANNTIFLFNKKAAARANEVDERDKKKRTKQKQQETHDNVWMHSVWLEMNGLVADSNNHTFYDM